MEVRAGGAKCGTTTELITLVKRKEPGKTISKIKRHTEPFKLKWMANFLLWFKGQKAIELRGHNVINS